MLQEALPSFYVQFECDLDASRTPIRRVISFLETCGFDRNECGGWEVAIQEGVNNAIIHSDPSKADAAEPIAIEVTVRPEFVEVLVHDHTEGFTWPITPDLPQPNSEDGRGVYMIQELMDESDYLRGTHSNRLLLRKKRSLGDVLNAEERQLQDRLSELEKKLDESDMAFLFMQEELSSCYESLSAIFKFGTELGKTDDIKGFAGRLLQQLISIMGADCFLFRTCDEQQHTLYSHSYSSEAFNLPSLQWHPGPSRGFLELTALLERKDIMRDTRLQPLDESDPLNAFQARHIQVHPIIIGDEPIGILSVGASDTEEPFTSAQTNVMHTFADFLAVQLINVARQEERVQYGKISKELEIARNIQNSLLPAQWPQMEHFTLAGECITSRNVSGDFYDVIYDEHDPNKILLVIADVMGKGVPASIFASIFRSLVRASSELFTQPAALMKKLNRAMFEDLSGVDMFITAQMAYCDLDQRIMRVSNAGHCPLLLSDKHDVEPVRSLSPEGLPLGVVKSPEIEEIELKIPEGCRMLMYTDGIVETTTRMIGNELLGQKRLVQWFTEARKEAYKAAGFKVSLKTILNAYNGDQLKDDQTFILLVENERCTES